MKSVHFCTFMVTFMVTLLLSAILTPDLLAQSPGSLATGQANLDLNDGVLRTVSFSAATYPDGGVSGSIQFRDPSPMPSQDVDGTGDPALAESPSGVSVQAELNCLAVEGDTAIVGGLVTQADPARYVGKQVLLFVEDSGRSRGRFTWGFYEAQQGMFCGSFPWAAYTPVGIAGGSLQVRP